MYHGRVKQEIRERVWTLLTERHVARFPLPLHDRIPNFAGAEEAAARLAETPEWKAARRLASGFGGLAPRAGKPDRHLVSMKIGAPLTRYVCPGRSQARATPAGRHAARRSRSSAGVAPQSRSAAYSGRTNRSSTAWASRRRSPSQ